MPDQIAALRRWTEYFDRQVRAHLAGAGHTRLSPAMERMLEQLRDDPTAGVTELAAASSISQQAISKLIRQLRTEHYVGDSPHPTDRRRRVLAVTDRGHAALAAAAAAREQLWSKDGSTVLAQVSP